MVNNKFINFSNVSDLCVVSSNALGTSQFVIKEEIKVPDNKPDIEQINNVNIRPEIINKKVVLIKDLRCQQLSFKALITGMLKETISYTACNLEQSVHTFESKQPFYGNVLLDFDLNLKNKSIHVKPTVNEINKQISVDFCIEDINVQPVHSRKVLKFVTLLIIINGDVKELLSHFIKS